MKFILRIIIILLGSVVVPSCANDRQSLTSEHQLLEIYNCAENTIKHEGNYPKTLELYLSFIRGAEDNPALERQLVKAYVSVAVIYGSFNDIDNAIVYNKKAFALARKLDDMRFSELALTNLAQSYLGKNNYDNTLAIADSLLSLNASESKTLKFHNSIIRGEVALQLNMYNEALRFFRKADSIAAAENLSRYERSAPSELIARYYEKVNMPDSQLVYLNKVWTLIEADKDPQPKAECARELMEFHTEHGNLREARRFQTTYLELTDSLVNIRNFLSVSANHQQRQIDSKGDEIDILNRKANHHKAIIIVIATLLSLAIIAIIIIICQKRNLNAAYRVLFEKDRRLIAIRSEKHFSKNDADRQCNDSEPDIASLSEEDTKEDERNRALYERIIQSMEATRDYLNPDFGLSNIVAMAGSNVAYVSKVVKRYSHQNVPSFINEYRIREACRRILDETNFGNITFAAIGESVGFSTQASFNRAFKKVTGMTPSIYQKMASAGHKSD